MSYLTNIKQESPLIFNVMNEVATNFAANGLIAIGASPAMSHTPREAVEMAQHADVVVLNLGTLTEERAEAMLLAGKSANESGVPVILDPIAIGATTFRTTVIHEILSTIKLAVICANAGEIAVLGNALDKTVSPDNVLAENDPAIAKLVAKKYDTIVVATGETDVITDGQRTILCQNGHEMLQNITASGCTLNSIIAAFVSTAEGDMYDACTRAVAGYGIAAEEAMKRATGPGSFIPAFLDQLYFLTDEIIAMQAKLNVMEEQL